eukprot:gb/GEZN01000490.1/.p1 GENE.gb/GEZN01000490.1/~~gb/GEZN01000490.1/.p1  ORF type:complete len:1400 (-),score=358.34 gb/GEZN01000490.1/:111-3830(-)
MVNKLVAGSSFIKYGRSGKPHVRFVSISRDLQYVRWGKSEKETRDNAHGLMGRSFSASEITNVYAGRFTKVFAKIQLSDKEYALLGAKPLEEWEASDGRALSIQTTGRTLDLEVIGDQKERDLWVGAFSWLITQTRQKQNNRNSVKQRKGSIHQLEHQHKERLKKAQLFNASSFKKKGQILQQHKKALEKQIFDKEQALTRHSSNCQLKQQQVLEEAEQAKHWMQVEKLPLLEELAQRLEEKFGREKELLVKTLEVLWERAQEFEGYDLKLRREGGGLILKPEAFLTVQQDPRLQPALNIYKVAEQNVAAALGAVKQVMSRLEKEERKDRKQRMRRAVEEWISYYGESGDLSARYDQSPSLELPFLRLILDQRTNEGQALQRWFMMLARSNEPLNILSISTYLQRFQGFLMTHYDLPESLSGPLFVLLQRGVFAKIWAPYCMVLRAGDVHQQSEEKLTQQLRWLQRLTMAQLGVPLKFRPLPPVPAAVPSSPPSSPSPDLSPLSSNSSNSALSAAAAVADKKEHTAIDKKQQQQQEQEEEEEPSRPLEAMVTSLKRVESTLSGLSRGVSVAASSGSMISWGTDRAGAALHATATSTTTAGGSSQQMMSALSQALDEYLPTEVEVDGRGSRACSITSPITVARSSPAKISPRHNRKKKKKKKKKSVAAAVTVAGTEEAEDQEAEESGSSLGLSPRGSLELPDAGDGLPLARSMPLVPALPGQAGGLAEEPDEPQDEPGASERFGGGEQSDWDSNRDGFDSMVAGSTLLSDASNEEEGDEEPPDEGEGDSSSAESQLEVPEGDESERRVDTVSLQNKHKQPQKRRKAVQQDLAEETRAGEPCATTAPGQDTTAAVLAKPLKGLLEAAEPLDVVGPVVPYSDCIAIFNELSRLTAPCDMKQCLVATARQIYRRARQYAVARGGIGQRMCEVGADDFFPIWFHVLIHSAVPGLFRRMKYMTGVTDGEEDFGETGYYLTCLEAALINVIGATPESMGVSEDILKEPLVLERKAQPASFSLDGARQGAQNFRSMVVRSLSEIGQGKLPDRQHPGNSSKSSSIGSKPGSRTASLRQIVVHGSGSGHLANSSSGDLSSPELLRSTSDEPHDASKETTAEKESHARPTLVVAHKRWGSDLLGDKMRKASKGLLESSRGLLESVKGSVRESQVSPVSSNASLHKSGADSELAPVLFSLSEEATPEDIKIRSLPSPPPPPATKHGERFDQDKTKSLAPYLGLVPLALTGV